MRRYVTVISLFAAVAVGFGMMNVFAADQPTTKPSDAAATQPANPVAVKVNGEKILESDIEEVFKASIAASPQAKKLKPEQLQQLRKRFRMRILRMLIDHQLFVQMADDPSVTNLKEEEYIAAAREAIEGNYKKAGLSKEEANKRIKQRFNMSLEELIKRRAKNPLFRQYVQQTKIIETKFPEKVKVTDEEVREYYDTRKEQLYEHPKQVQASHILVKTQGLKSEEEREKARQKIEKIKEEVNKSDADFATLARRYSGCPSGKRSGGDLGYFDREKMAKPFSDAAFAMEVGEISDIVETQFGYHIIKKTGEKPASTTAFEEVKEGIRMELKNKKLQQVRNEQLAKLKKEADIVYPPGKEPKPVTRRRVRPSTQPAGKQAETRPESSKKVITKPEPQSE
jgi:peptidyl-prolyl cis-trans isomerase C